MKYSEMTTAQPNRWTWYSATRARVRRCRRPTRSCISPSSRARERTRSPARRSCPELHQPKATINGHEYNVNPNTLDDLQYACIFELPSSMARDCTQPAFTSTDPALRRGCDCRTSATDNVADRNRPLCQPPGGGPAGTEQYAAKAFPTTRHLDLLQRMKSRGVAGSICPKTTGGDPNASAYGYNAVFGAVVARLHESLE